MPRFRLFEGAGERRCERTYARNNPLKYVDPDGMLPKDIAWIGNMLEGVARPVKGMALRTWAQVFGAARRGAKHLIFPKGTTKRDIADFAGGLHKRGAHVVAETDAKGAHFHIQLPNKEVLKSGEKSEMFVRYGGKPSLHIYIESSVVAGMFILDRWQSADAEAPEVVPDASDPRFTSYDYTSMWEAREASERQNSDDDESGDGVPRLVRVRDKDGNWSFQMR
ncbi:MAG: hypothetical protein EDX89_24535 [Acidobacteria bacterium]|nr:MAG: hypothetical protein EDX89_24535 [Acidobacteriota bacterium]